MIGREWSKPTVLLKADFIEDPLIHQDHWGIRWLYYSRGPNLQDQRVYRRKLGSGGAMGQEESAHDAGTHTRIERGRLTTDLALFTASWPGPPTGGIMAFRQHPWGDTRTIVLPIQPNTGYSFIAANPCATRTDQTGVWDIIFEGCVDATCQWNLFRATWREGEMAVVDPEPLFAGANPSLFDGPGVQHLVFSRLTDRGYKAGFETCMVSQELP